MKKLQFACVVFLFMLMLPGMGTAQVQAQAGSRTFPETGKTVRGVFLQYWDRHGGLAQQGFPISEEMQEVSETDGKVYTVQYFERAVFEWHPENAPPHNVLLSLMGNFLYKQKYPAGPPRQTANTSAGSVLFKETGKRLGGRFLEYWQQNGGLPQQGYPISDEFVERSALDGKEYRVQYFERAVFEYHPEKQRPYDVLLSHLGTFRWRGKYETQANCGSPILPGLWTGQLRWGFTMSGSSIAGNGEVSGPVRLNVACDGTFSGTVQITSYNTRIGSGNLAILTCSQSQVTIADIAGRVERAGGDKRLNILGGVFKQGVYTCVNPMVPARPTNLAGNTVPPTMVEIEQESRNKISGKQWVPDPSYVSMIEQFRTAYRDVNIVYTGQWELNRQEVNTP
ncbi:MAG: hypothetical protein M3437_02405 [Chloroflexota bacterium]|nr:hypothetical protein [Chloroflexota bacterium]MDQ5865814.1 hypothetical protein [Chloroflexota bacterium]